MEHSASRQGRRLQLVGVLLFLLALIVGILIPKFAVPRVALSVHLLGIMQGTFLIAIGLLWPKLAFGRGVSRVTFVLAVYGCVGAWVSNLLAATWGAGSALLPFAAGHAQGSTAQEMAIAIGLRSAAVSLIGASVLIGWGLLAARDD
jgi:hydroxylaminobenzene mutase